MDAAALMNAVKDQALATGLFETVNGHQPLGAPSNGITAAIWLGEIIALPGASGLAEVSIKVTINIRIFSNLLQEPRDAIDPNIATAVSALFTAYCGSFTLGGLVRNVDIFGEFGTPLAAIPGYADFNGTKYRVMTIALPLIISDEYPEVP